MNATESPVADNSLLIDVIHFNYTDPTTRRVTYAQLERYADGMNIVVFTQKSMGNCGIGYGGHRGPHGCCTFVFHDDADGEVIALAANGTETPVDMDPETTAQIAAELATIMTLRLNPRYRRHNRDSVPVPVNFAAGATWFLKRTATGRTEAEKSAAPQTPGHWLDCCEP